MTARANVGKRKSESAKKPTGEKGSRPPSSAALPARSAVASVRSEPAQLSLLATSATTSPRAADSRSASDTPLVAAPIVRQEANLLRFPFFALGRKGLANRKGVLVRGTTTIREKPCDFEYRITCNSDDLYPGPLARKVHFGLVYLLQSKQKPPYQNPVEFTWRELARTIGCSGSGRMQQLLKQAVRSIHGTRIRSTYALKNDQGVPMKSRERGFSLYREYIFFNEVMPDRETLADKNFVWLSDWYLHNLNSLYCGPLDFAVWQRLDDRSPIASRLYEFLTFNFTGPWPSFTIDYENLCRFLPVVAKPHPSQAQQQFAAALKLLSDERVVADVAWLRGKRGQLQLRTRRGARLQPPVKHAPLPEESLEPSEIRDLVRRQSPEEELICQFHGLMFGDDSYRPNASDRRLARDVISQYGSEQAEQLLPSVVALVQERFPKAKTFGATTRYWPEAVEARNRTRRSAERRTQEFIEEQAEQDREQQQEAERKVLTQVWNKLPAAEQASIRAAVLANQPPQIEKFEGLVTRLCLAELAKRRQAD